jgi:hypothetical protein
LAIDDGVPVQKVSYPKLRERLLKDGQVLEYKASATAKSGKLEGVVIDDTQAIKVGDWTHGGAAKNFVGDGYSHDGNEGKGAKSITFRASLPKAGKYEVRFAYAPNKNRCNAVPVIVRHAGGEATVVVNETKPGAFDGLTVTLGTFEFESGKPAEVFISTKGTTGYVVADAAQWIAK